MLKTKLTLFAIVSAATALCSSADTVVATFEFSQEDLVFTTKEGGDDAYDYVYMPGELQSTTPGAPCFKHGPNPCPQAGEDRASPCLRNLEPEAVIRAALGLLVKGRRGAARLQGPKKRA